MKNHKKSIFPKGNSTFWSKINLKHTVSGNMKSVKLQELEISPQQLSIRAWCRKCV